MPTQTPLRTPADASVPGAVPTQLDPNAKANDARSSIFTRPAVPNVPQELAIGPDASQVGPQVQDTRSPDIRGTFQPATRQTFNDTRDTALTEPAPNPANPVGAPPTFDFPTANVSPIDPNNSLRGQNIFPTDPSGSLVSPEAAQARQVASGALGSLEGPDRGQIAQDVLSQLRESSQEGFNQDRRAIGQDAARFGRIGSGVTTTRLGDALSNREQDFARASRELSSEAAGLSLSDRRGILDSALGAGSQFTGEDLSRDSQRFNQGFTGRQELRGERDFETQQARLALEDRVRQTTLSDDLLNSAFNRDQSRLALLGSNAFGSNPNGVLLDAAGNRQNAADASGNTAAQLLYLQALQGGR